jgi:hypothetical protein
LRSVLVHLLLSEFLFVFMRFHDLFCDSQLSGYDLK